MNRQRRLSYAGQSANKTFILAYHKKGSLCGFTENLFRFLTFRQNIPALHPYLSRSASRDASSRANRRADSSASSGAFPAVPTSTSSDPVVAC